MARTWQEIAAEAAKEKDSEKLIALAVELDHALEERDKVLRKPAQRSLGNNTTTGESQQSPA